MRLFLQVLLVSRVVVVSSAFGGAFLQIIGKSQQASSTRFAQGAAVQSDAETSRMDRKTLILSPTSALTNAFIQNPIQITALPVMLSVPLLYILSPAHHIGTNPPYAEAEILSDMSHLLDLLDYFTPETLVLRLATVIGRILCIASDYVQDGTVAPTELIFQSSILAVSMGTLLKSALPLLGNNSAGTSFRDRVAYKVLFRPVGLSWLQFRAIAANAVEWLEVDPNTTIDPTDAEVEYSYWLYKGDAKICWNGSVVQQLSMHRNRKSANSSDDIGLLAHEALARLAEETKCKENPFNLRVKNDDTPYRPQTSIQVGSEGATLLRVDARKLIQLMNDDERIDSAIRKLLLKGMHRRLEAWLTSTAEEARVSGPHCDQNMEDRTTEINV